MGLVAPVPRLPCIHCVGAPTEYSRRRSSSQLAHLFHGRRARGRRAPLVCPAPAARRPGCGECPPHLLTALRVQAHGETRHNGAQGSDTLVTSRKCSTDSNPRERDVEKAPATSIDDIDDPFKLRMGRKSAEELEVLRRRRPNGKKLETYQRNQNEVRK